jgi:hypothetical protein
MPPADQLEGVRRPEQYSITQWGFRPVLQLESLKDTEAGQTAIVLGNGESLNAMPRKLLSKYDSFGANHIYLCGIQPTYYVVVDTTSLTTYAAQIKPTATRAKVTFLSSLYANDPNPSTRELFALPNACLFSKDQAAFSGERYVSGHTVVYVALKMAYYLGYNTALLFGVDHDPSWKHCADNYPPGVTTTQEKKQEMRWHLEYANRVYREAGRRILNLSRPSELDSIIARGDPAEWLA